MLRILLALSLLGLAVPPAAAAVVWRNYSYFSVSGKTLDELMIELSIRGPQVRSTGQRHPGATKLQFNTRLGYTEGGGKCWISAATATIKARIILPRWKDRRKAGRELRIYWDALAADIKRHEEGHVVIAKNYASQLEKELAALPRQDSCKPVAQQAELQIEKVLEQYRKESERFDRVESASFDRRMQSLYQYRLERIESGRLPEP
ncbi:DUF922 domain-containing protein [Mesorhizobium sp. YM1C-6-2]|uniref:DUF922 domain-containing Zn-dependent protease n=1 Tax=Mesorhizobium sp. YM1C-6-2 TaxID=1827501 RepID=UPI000EF215CE|nr:DUF922 domain-containing protein [Mesorhizobium sp. YM1C-6-2]RLP21908.1 DUF922 domain-containing protein [Mesorhizobium sp. YM1C-6-2]